MDYSGWGLVALRDECDEKGIKYSKEDTPEILREKLSLKPAKTKK